MKKVFITLFIIATSLHDTSAQTLDWVKQLGGDTYVYPEDAAIDATGNVHVTGIFGGTADFDPGPGTANLSAQGLFDGFVAKLDGSGNYLWAKKIGGSMNVTGTAIAVDGSGNVHVTGFFEGSADFDPGAGVTTLTSAGSTDLFVVKLDVSGNLVWARNMGGSVADAANDIFVDSNGNVYTTGSFQGTADFDPGAGTVNITSEGFKDIIISKLDMNGDFVWAKSMGGPSTDFSKSITVDASSNVYTTGFFQNTGDFDPGAGVSNLVSIGTNGAFISKLDASGNFVWAKSTSSSDVSSSESGTAITVDASGNTYTSGGFIGTADFDPGAGTANLTSAGQSDVFVLKLDASGNHIWSKSFGGTDSDIVRDIDIDESLNVYTTGYFFGTSDFDPGSGAVNLTSQGSFDVFVSILISSGDFGGAVSMGATGADFGQSVVVDLTGNIYTTGYFQGTVDFDPGAGVFNLTENASSASDGFVHKMNSISLGVLDSTFDQTIKAYPNPSTGKFWVSLGQDHEDLKVNIFNYQGRLVHSQLHNNLNTIPLNIDFLPSGVYFLNIHSALKQATIKVIKH